MRSRAGCNSAALHWRTAGCRSKFPRRRIKQTVTTDASGRAEFHFSATLRIMVARSSQTLRCRVVELAADKVRDSIGFRTIETRGTQILLNGKPIFLRGMAMHEEAPLRGGRAFSPRGCGNSAGMGPRTGLQFRSPDSLSAQRKCDPPRGPYGLDGMVGNPGLLGHRLGKSSHAAKCGGSASRHDCPRPQSGVSCLLVAFERNSGQAGATRHFCGSLRSGHASWTPHV